MPSFWRWEFCLDPFYFWMMKTTKNKRFSHRNVTSMIKYYHHHFYRYSFVRDERAVFCSLSHSLHRQFVAPNTTQFPNFIHTILQRSVNMRGKLDLNNRYDRLACRIWLNFLKKFKFYEIVSMSALCFLLGHLWSHQKRKEFWLTNSKCKKWNEKLLSELVILPNFQDV